MAGRGRRAGSGSRELCLGSAPPPGEWHKRRAGSICAIWAGGLFFCDRPGMGSGRRWKGKGRPAKRGTGFKPLRGSAWEGRGSHAHNPPLPRVTPPPERCVQQGEPPGQWDVGRGAAKLWSAACPASRRTRIAGGGAADGTDRQQGWAVGALVCCWRRLPQGVRLAWAGGSSVLGSADRAAPPGRAPANALKPRCLDLIALWGGGAEGGEREGEASACAGSLDESLSFESWPGLASLGIPQTGSIKLF